MPRPGTKLRVQLAQYVDRMADRFTTWLGHDYEGGTALVRLIHTSAGVEAAILLREGLVDPVYWGSLPTLRLR